MQPPQKYLLAAVAQFTLKVASRLKVLRFRRTMRLAGLNSQVEVNRA